MPFYLKDQRYRLYFAIMKQPSKLLAIIDNTWFSKSFHVFPQPRGTVMPPNLLRLHLLRWQMLSYLPNLFKLGLSPQDLWLLGAIWTILFLELSYSFFSKANCLISSQTLSMWFFSSSTCPTILELRNLPSPSHAAHVLSRATLYTHQVFPTQHWCLFIIQISIWLLWLILLLRFSY